MWTRRRFILLSAAPLAAPLLTEAPRPGLWRCTNHDCDPYIYDPAQGDADNINGHGPIPPGTPFAALPDDWICPLCGDPKDSFVRWHPLTG